MICIISVPVFSFAESGIEIDENNIEVQMWPENPEPYKDVTITLTSYSTDLNKAIIEWSIGSKIVLSGYGKVNYSTTALGPDSNTDITVKITPEGSINSVTKKLSLRPSDIDVLWESVDGYTPLFYKGKSLISKEGTIKLVAIPNSSSIKKDKGSIAYKWRRDDETVEAASGYNKNTYIFENNVLRPSENITLTASSIDGVYNATKNLEIPTYSPKLLFYKKSPTEGTQYNKALSDNTVFEGDEMTIVAAPYFLAIKGNEYSFDYKWSINGDPIKTPSKKTELTIRPTSRGGYADIDVVLENIDKLFQKVSGSLKLTL